MEFLVFLSNDNKITHKNMENRFSYKTYIKKMGVGRSASADGRRGRSARRLPFFQFLLENRFFIFLFFYFIIILIKNTGNFIFYIIPKAPEVGQPNPCVCPLGPMAPKTTPRRSERSKTWIPGALPLRLHHRA